MNKSEEIPSLSPIVVESAVTNAEWLDGIPPVRHISKSKKTEQV